MGHPEEVFIIYKDNLSSPAVFAYCMKKQFCLVQCSSLYFSGGLIFQKDHSIDSIEHFCFLQTYYQLAIPWHKFHTERQSYETREKNRGII